jgi:phosphatidylethanolamine/phosphatidyl-N-methylethanolamine N-methyltransferase
VSSPGVERKDELLTDRGLVVGAAVLREDRGASLLPGDATAINKIIAMSNTAATYLHFFWAGLARHGQTGGIVPSQRFLIAKMIAPVPETYRGRIIELGAGNGALTLRLAARCPEARILGCEINPTLARDHRRNLAAARLSGRVELFAGSAADLLSQIGQAQKPDFIISGIPLGNLGREKALSLVDTIHQTLGEGGMYIQFQHSLLDRKKIRTRFPNVRTVPAFLNFPPAFVYYAQR